ncbi:MAG: hypothetical protein CMM55_11285 [Rhodospirillaceae bacterium]|nr:hypothetical protein [Rhodospirillaceae bacterium]
MMTPLENVKVLNLGTRWAGQVAALLLADQGAEVVEITRPANSAKSEAIDALLGRGKRLIELDLNTASGRAQALKLTECADIVLENMRPGAVTRLGLDNTTLRASNPQLTTVSLPGFAPGDPRSETAAWEGSINAATGVYTDLSPLGPLLGRTPVYSAIPMASAYGGVLGAVTASLGLYHRLATGVGQHFTVPLADAVMSAMALLIAHVEGQPNRYDFPPIERSMREVAFPILKDVSNHLDDKQVTRLLDYVRSFASPGLGSYPAADGKLVFICANDHIYQTRALLQTLGIFDRLIAEGMEATSPYVQGSSGKNLYKAAGLTMEWRTHLRQEIAAAIKSAPAADWEQRLREANVPATVVRTTTEWLTEPGLHEAGVTADLDDAELGPVRQAGRFVSLEGEAQASPALRHRETEQAGGDFQSAAITSTAASSEKNLLDGIKVLDFSNIIAGPAAGRTLAEFGAEVIRVDPPAPQAGPFATMWFGIDVNQGKRAIILDLKTEAGRQAIAELITDTDVVLHNFLDRSAERLGIDHSSLKALNPDIISCQISAWGGSNGGPYKDDPAFDPVMQAASGIMTRYGTPEQPVLHGIASCVDYMTGFLATLGIVQALSARALGRGGSYVRTSLAMAAQLVQFPFMASVSDTVDTQHEPRGQQARGQAPHQSLYQFADGWAYLGCAEADSVALRTELDISGTDAASYAVRLQGLTIAEVRQHLADIVSASVCEISTLAAIRAERTEDQHSESNNWLNTGSFALVRDEHPSGYPTTLPRPTWVRPDQHAIQKLTPAPAPGAHTEEVLRGSGMDEKKIRRLFEAGVARKAWPALSCYLPD